MTNGKYSFACNLCTLCLILVAWMTVFRLLPCRRPLLAVLATKPVARIKPLKLKWGPAKIELLVKPSQPAEVDASVWPTVHFFICASFPTPSQPTCSHCTPSSHADAHDASRSRPSAQVHQQQLGALQQTFPGAIHVRKRRTIQHSMVRPPADRQHLHGPHLPAFEELRQRAYPAWANKATHTHTVCRAGFVGGRGQRLEWKEASGNARVCVPAGQGGVSVGRKGCRCIGCIGPRICMRCCACTLRGNMA